MRTTAGRFPEGLDWFAIFNPKIKNGLDVNLVHTLMHESVVCCVQFSPDGKYLATGCNRTAQIYDVETGVKTCQQHSVLMDETAGTIGDLYLRSVCFSPDGKYLVTGAEDRRITSPFFQIWDIATKQIISFFDGHQDVVSSLAFSSDGRLLASGSGDKTVRIWDITDGASKTFTINDPDSINQDSSVTSVAISPNGQYVAAGSLDTIVRIWDMNTGQLVERLQGHRDSVYSVRFTPDGKSLVSGSLDEISKYWDLSALVLDGAIRGLSALNLDGAISQQELQLKGGADALFKRDGEQSQRITQGGGIGGLPDPSSGIMGSPLYNLGQQSQPQQQLPQQSLTDMSPADFMDSVASQLKDFDSGLFIPDGDINFERDFGQWFVPDDTLYMK
ncbi:WD40 repeat-like protein [Marasmius fiardii PR-910]|nr:WD40 repeat-like protein [Marasmius fiardii PR-910]